MVQTATVGAVRRNRGGADVRRQARSEAGQPLSSTEPCLEDEEMEEEGDPMAPAEVAEEEAMAVEVAAPADGADELFSMAEAEEQVRPALLEEHRVAVAQF